MLGSDGGKQLKAFARVGAVGIELALSTVIGMLGGQWLDEKLSTKPYLTLVGLILGVVAGFRSLIRATRQNAERSDASDKPDEPDNE